MVKFEADLLDMPGLFVAEQIAGAALIEVVAGQLETGAECVERRQHLQALFGAFGDALVGRCRQIGIGAGLGAPDAAADLVKLGEAEAIGAVDDQRVGGRDVETRFDNRGGEQHVVALVVKGAHPFFDFGRRHLAVRRYRLHLRHLFADELFDIGKIGDARHDKEALPAAIMLAQQGLAQHDFIEWHHISADGEAIDRRRCDDRHFAQAG